METAVQAHMLFGGKERGRRLRDPGKRMDHRGIHARQGTLALDVFDITYKDQTE